MNKYIKMFMNDHNLKVGERFKASGGDKVYYFDDEGKLRDEIDCMSRAKILMCFLWGTYEVEKLSLMPSEKFKPKKGEQYYRINNYGLISATVNDSEMDDYYFEHNFAFRTRSEVEDYKWFLDKIDEYRKPFEFDKENRHISYDYDDNAVFAGYNSKSLSQGSIYFGSYENIKAFIKEVGEERIKKYMFDIWE